MKNILLLCLIFSSVLGAQNFSEAKSYVYNPTNYKTQETIFDKDLNMVEMYMFRRTFFDNNIVSRLNRIEQNLFNRIYSDRNISSRVNNILANYRQDYGANDNSYYQDRSYRISPRRFLMNRLIGQPTGYSPQVTMPNFGSFVPQFSNNYQGPGEYRYNNSVPASAGMGIHILD